MKKKDTYKPVKCKCVGCGTTKDLELKITIKNKQMGVLIVCKKCFPKYKDKYNWWSDE